MKSFVWFHSGIHLCAHTATLLITPLGKLMAYHRGRLVLMSFQRIFEVSKHTLTKKLHKFIEIPAGAKPWGFFYIVLHANLLWFPWPPPVCFGSILEFWGAYRFWLAPEGNWRGFGSPPDYRCRECQSSGHCQLSSQLTTLNPSFSREKKVKSNYSSDGHYLDTCVTYFTIDARLNFLSNELWRTGAQWQVFQQCSPTILWNWIPGFNGSLDSKWMILVLFQLIATRRRHRDAESFRDRHRWN